MRRLACGVRTGMSVAMVVALTACSDGLSAPSSNKLSSQEAQTVAMSIFSEVSQAMAGIGISPNRAPAGASLAIVAPTSTFSSACSSGGKIGGSFSYSDNVNNAGNGSVSGTMTITPQSCMVSTGSRLIAVNGQFVYTFSMSFAGYNQSSDFIWHGSGSFTWSGGSCSMDYSARVSTRGTVAISGNVCGESISGTY